MLKMHRDLDFMDEDEDYEPLEKVLPDWVLSQVSCEGYSV